MRICEYGCGREATHQFKNGKWCCERSTSKCPGLQKKRLEKITGNLSQTICL